jgi:hypothetical protein
MNVIAAQPDLFGNPGLAGLSQDGAIVTPGEEHMLITSIDAAELSPFRFHGWLGKRLTVSYGWRYDFDDNGFAPAEPIPDWLLPVRARAARFAGMGAQHLCHGGDPLVDHLSQPIGEGPSGGEGSVIDIHLEHGVPSGVLSFRQTTTPRQRNGQIDDDGRQTGSAKTR